MTNLIEKLLGAVAPGMALARARDRLALDHLRQAAAKTAMRYDAAQRGRATSFRPTRADADAAAAQRLRLAMIAHDMIRNTAFGRRLMDVIAANVVGDGIIPKVSGGSDKARAQMLATIEAHFDTTRIDASGRATLYGLQHQAMSAVVAGGEVLLRRRRRDMSDGLPLPLQLQIMEADHLDTARDGILPNGNQVRNGIEFDLIERVAAYWVFDVHPGATGWRLAKTESRRVPASEMAHMFRIDRPGQTRGVSWFAPIALKMQDLHDYDDAQLLRQRIAACFAGYVVGGSEDDQRETAESLQSIIPGRVQFIKGDGAEIKFPSPPGVESYDEFISWGYRAIAAAMGLTYEAATGDLSGVNFTSYKAGRIEMNRNVSGWQWRMAIPMLCDPIGQWAMEAFALQHPGLMLGRAKAGPLRLQWVPPAPALIDPNREIPALIAKVRGGLASRPQVIREMGFDAERVTAEITDDLAGRAGLIFDTDVGAVSASGVTQARPAGSVIIEDGSNGHAE